MENAARGTSVLTVSAQDSDSEPRNRLIDYRLVTSSSAVPFDVSTSTGDVLVTGVVDYESQSEYTIVVVATDHGSPPLSSSCTLVIDVLDANDHAPIFTSSVYTVSVNESAVSGTILLQVIIRTILVCLLIILCFGSWADILFPSVSCGRLYFYASSIKFRFKELYGTLFCRL